MQCDDDSSVKRVGVVCLNSLDYCSLVPGVTFAGSTVRDGLAHVSVVTLLAVMAMTSCCVVSTVQTDATTSPPRQFVELHVETTTSGMQVTVAR